MRDDAVLRRALPLGRGLGRFAYWEPAGKKAESDHRVNA